VNDVLNVRQIGQYPLAPSVGPADLALLQQGGLGGSYASILVSNLIATALENGGSLHVEPGFGIAWNGASLSSDGVGFTFSGTLNVPSLNSSGDIFVAGAALATQVDTTALFDSLLENSVWTVNGRKGNVWLQTSDILQAGAAPIQDAHFGGYNTSPTPWDFRANSDQIATTAFVQNVIEQLICGGSIVTSFNGRGGDVILTTADVNAAYANYPNDLIAPTAPSPALGDASNKIATTLFVDESIQDAISEAVFTPDLALYAPLASPAFSGIPTAPTANAGTATAQLATTAFVQAAVTASTTGVSSFNTRTGAVTLTAADVTAAGAAPLASPNFTGTPMAPTAAVGTSTQQLATTAFVLNEIGSIAAGVASFNGRSGIVTLTTADVTGAGGAPIAAPAFTGIPTAPTAAAATNTTQLATTAFVLANSVLSFNGRQGAVTLTNNDVTAAGGAVTNSPTFTGTPLAPTAAVGTNSTQLATTAFVAAAIAAGGGVTTFNGRAGAVTLTLADITGAGGAPLASPALTGTPTVPTAAPGTATTQAASTAFVLANRNAQPPQVTTLLSGTGTYTTPAGATWLAVEMVGGGGGGTGVSYGTSGTASTFGAGLTAGPGLAQSAAAQNPAGGNATGGDFNLQGGLGNGGTQQGGNVGGASYFGGAGGSSAGASGGPGAPNSGSGGGGAAAPTGQSGSISGAAGGYLRKLIAPPTASYAYAVGTGGNGGSAGSGYNAGGNGGSGVIIVTAHFD
jgi:hypothetical protein